jgi:hypothetical protein
MERERPKSPNFNVIIFIFWKVVTDDVVVDDVDVLLFKSQPRPRSLDHL